MKTIVTHNGDFHADDVFAAATIMEAHPQEEFEIVRTRDQEWFRKGDFVVDVCGENDAPNNRFDHHQIEGAGKRENEIPYAAFGLVWKKYGAELCGDESIADRIDQSFVAPLDASDVGVDIYDQSVAGVAPVTLPYLVSLFRPTWKEGPEILDPTFNDLVSYARIILQKVIHQAKAATEAETLVKEAYNDAADKRVIILDKKLPVGVLGDFPEPLYVVYPSTAGDNWRGKAIRKDMMSFENRKDFPKEWRGLRDEELEEKCGVSGAQFCHLAGFLIAAKTKEAVMEMVGMALEA